MVGGEAPIAAFLIVLTGLAYLAFVDAKRLEVDGWSTAALAAATLIAFRVDGLTGWQWIWAAAAGALVFVFYLELGVEGRVGGGDVKLAAIPAAVIGTVSPMLAVWAVLVAFGVQSFLRLLARIFVGPSVTELPHVPAMFAGFAAAIVFGQAMLLI
ncbi:prepilin peptidase [Leifsonia sp. Leaf264]|uniref:prepilin peptidase n=1 Tax=Leifsonia sp. Leaf264 TaxID=1736314 RepID=UPI0006F7785C|nr:prepilin peptidase [Leifsonia sp. Leaf264]KQO98704.1 hypothetical protein ASF30_11620 [Leifsonia sp. Leaf264]